MSIITQAAPPVTSPSTRSADTKWPQFHESSLYESASIEVASSTEIDLGMAKITALSAMSVVCQNIADIQIPNASSVPLSLFTLVSAVSGDRKTATQALFFKSIIDFEKEKIREYAQQNETFKIHEKNWLMANKELDKMYRNAIKAGQPVDSIVNKQIALHKEKPTPNPQPRLIYEDITPSAMAYSLFKNLPFACLLSSEGGGIFNGKAMQDISLYNSAWSGQSITVDRKSTIDFCVDDPRLTLALMIQPEILDSYLAKSGKEAQQNGFTARLLYMKSESRIGSRTGNTPPPNKNTMDFFYKRCEDLLHQSLRELELGNHKQVLELSPSAKSLWMRFVAQVEKDMLKHAIYFHARDHGSKLMDNVARVAAIIHIFEGYKGDIHSDTLQYAYSLCRVYSYQYLEFVAGKPEIVILVNYLVRDIRKLGTQQGDIYTFCDSDISQRCHNSLRPKSKREAAMHFLEEMGHLTSTNGSKFLFKETIIGSHEPSLKNGFHYNVEELYLFCDQELKPGYDSRPEYRLKQIPPKPEPPFEYTIVKPPISP